MKIELQYKGANLYTTRKKLPFSELFTFRPKIEALDSQTVEKITKLVAYSFEENKKESLKLGNKTFQNSIRWSWTSRDLLFKGIDWMPINERGTLTKRIKTHFYKKFEVKLDPQILEKVGMIIADNVVATKEYSLDTTRTFNWGAGDFGDAGSCFFGGRTGIRMDMMSDGGFKAVRFFTKDLLGSRLGSGKYYKDYAGIGRAWIWTTKVMPKTKGQTVIDPEVYVIFNGYGPNTHWQASFVAAYLGLPMKAITLTNRGLSDHGLYVNDDIGYVIGDRAVIESITTLDFGVKEYFCKKAGFKE